MLDRKPRRRIVMLAKIEADSWGDLRSTLRSLDYDIIRDGCLSKSIISGGYSTGHIIVTSEDESITHNSWEAELDAYLEDLAARESRPSASDDGGRG